MTTTEDLEPPPAPEPRHWGRIFGLGFLALVLVLLLLHVLWAGQSSKRLRAQLRAYAAAGEPTTPEELAAWASANAGAGENAVPFLRAAAGAVAKTPEWEKAFRQAWLLPLTDKEAAAFAGVVKQNAKALEAVDEAVKRTAVDWGLKYRSPMMLQTQDMSDITAQREVAQLLQAAALAAHHAGDDAEAVRRVGQILFVARATDHQPTFIGHLVGMGLGALGCQTAAQLAPDLNIAPGRGAAHGPAPAAAVKALVDGLLDEQAFNEARRRAWAGERVGQADMILCTADGRLGAMVPFGGPAAPIQSIGYSISRYAMKPYLFENGRLMVKFTTQVMDASAKSPDWPALERVIGPDPPEVKNSPTRYMLASVLLPSLRRGAEQHYRALADRRLTATVLAARLYAADHDGRLPARLDDLVPKYLPAIPIDPLISGGMPLGYVNEEKDPQRPRVYSVGSNGVDDGGKEPDPNATRRTNERTSDEVRHVKRQPRPAPVDELADEPS